MYRANRSDYVGMGGEPVRRLTIADPTTSRKVVFTHFTRTGLAVEVTEGSKNAGVSFGVDELEALRAFLCSSEEKES